MADYSNKLTAAWEELCAVPVGDTGMLVGDLVSYSTCRDTFDELVEALEDCSSFLKSWYESYDDDTPPVPFELKKLEEWQSTLDRAKGGDYAPAR